MYNAAITLKEHLDSINMEILHLCIKFAFHTTTNNDLKFAGAAKALNEILNATEQCKRSSLSTRQVTRYQMHVRVTCILSC